MEITARTEEALHILSVIEKRIDAAVAIDFKTSVRKQADGRSGTMVLDLSRVEFVDSSGLGAIVATMKHLGQDRDLALAGLTPAVQRVFQLTRMDSVFNIFATLDGARSGLK